MVFAALAFVNSNGIGQGDFIDFLPFVLDVLFGIADIDHILLNSKDFPHIAVEDAFFIVIMLLHDLIADAENYVSPFQLTLPFSWRIESALDELIEVFHAARVLVHRRQNLDGELIPRFQELAVIENTYLFGPLGFVFDFDEAEFRVFIDHRQSATVDEMGIRDDTASFLLPENGIQADNRDLSRCDDVMQDRAGSDGRQLVCVADEDATTLRFQGAEEMIHHFHVEHGYFIDDDQIGRQQLGLVVFKDLDPALPAIGDEQAMDGLSLALCRFSQAFGGPPGRRTEEDAQPFLFGQADDGLSCPSQGRR